MFFQSLDMPFRLIDKILDYFLISLNKPFPILNPGHTQNILHGTGQPETLFPDITHEILLLIRRHAVIIHDKVTIADYSCERCPEIM